MVDDLGRLLVVRRGQPPEAGRWSVPGGRIEAGETPEVAVVRELLEETGLEVEVGALVGELSWEREGFHYRVRDFAATVAGGTLTAGGDAAAVAWMGRGELLAAGPTEQLLGFLDDHGVRLAP